MQESENSSSLLENIYCCHLSLGHGHEMQLLKNALPFHGTGEEMLNADKAEDLL